MDSNEFYNLISDLREGRNKEFKQSTPWQETEFKCKIVKSVLAFTNVRDGGYIIIGIKELDNNTFDLEGMTENDLPTYNEDELSSVIAEYADPYVRIELDKASYNNKEFLIIKIHEFDDIPVICRQDKHDGKGQLRLRKGTIYTRSYRIPESVEVPSQTEMREILERAVEKQLRKYLTRQTRIGIPIQPQPSDEDLFRKQREDIE
jgi:predicted HTH transcriptional regulator